MLVKDDVWSWHSIASTGFLVVVDVIGVLCFLVFFFCQGSHRTCPDSRRRRNRLLLLMGRSSKVTLQKRMGGGRY